MSLRCAGRTNYLQDGPVETQYLQGLLRSCRRQGGAPARQAGARAGSFVRQGSPLCCKSGGDQKMKKRREGTIITSGRHRSCLRGDALGGGKLPTFSSRPGSLGSRRSGASARGRRACGVAGVCGRGKKASAGSPATWAGASTEPQIWAGGSSQLCSRRVSGVAHSFTSRDRRYEVG